MMKHSEWWNPAADLPAQDAPDTRECWRYMWQSTALVPESIADSILVRNDRL